MPPISFACPTPGSPDTGSSGIQHPRRVGRRRALDVSAPVAPLCPAAPAAGQSRTDHPARVVHTEHAPCPDESQPGILGWVKCLDRVLCGAAASGRGAFAKTRWRTTATTATFPEAVRENEEVVPVNVLTWVLPSGVTVGR